MIDPDNIILAENNKNTEIDISAISPEAILFWDLEDTKERNKFIKTVEREVRRSFEYKEFIFALKDIGMDQCAFIKFDPELRIKIEIHHYPFTLFDIVDIVIKKREYYGESLDVQMVAKEVCMLHYKILVGLIPLSKTVHQLFHDGKLFIPVDNVFGRWDLFAELYKDFCTEQQLDTLRRIKLYSEEQSELINTDILNMNPITINAGGNKEYVLPSTKQLQIAMADRIGDIKNNNYRLPTIEEYIENKTNQDTIEDRSIKIKPYHFDPDWKGENNE